MLPEKTNIRLGLEIVIGIGAVLAVSLIASRFIWRAKKKKKITRIIDTIEELQKPNVHMKDLNKVEDIVCQLINGGASKLQVISDFDHTITRIHYQQKPCSSTYSILDSSPYIPEECRKKAKDLHSKYYPIEIDPTISIEDKIPKMVEWYTQAHQVVGTSGVKKSDFTKMVKSSDVMLRSGCEVLFDTLNRNGIPLLIFSAGLGDLVKEVLTHFGTLYPNMKFVGNFMDFDEEGNTIGFKGEVIHMFNKNQSSIHNSEYFNQLKHRNNIILLGDSLGDLQMADGVPQPANVLRIGFLNHKVEESLPKYIEGYDIVLVDDQSMDLVNGLLQRIL